MMTVLLRDEIAIAAMQGILASVTTKAMADEFTTNAKARGIQEEELVAKMAYAFAEAMLAERAKS